jgi:hypothetical protein
MANCVLQAISLSGTAQYAITYPRLEEMTLLFAQFIGRSVSGRHGNQLVAAPDLGPFQLRKTKYGN